jgi:predicted membrane protein
VKGNAMSDDGTRTEWHFSLLGGREIRGKLRLDHNIASISVIGGFDIDLSQAEIVAPEVTITKISVIGGIDAVVPENARVEVSGFNLIGGRRIDAGSPADNAPTVRVRAYTILGGVKIIRR